jgi:hypothetical protein
MEKMPHCSKSLIWHYTAERQAEFCCIRHPLSDWNLSQFVGADLSSSRACDASPDRDLERSSALPETNKGRERLVKLSYHSADETSKHMNVYGGGGGTGWSRACQ